MAYNAKWERVEAALEAVGPRTPLRSQRRRLEG